MPWWKYETDEKYPWILPETESDWRAPLAFALMLIMAGCLVMGVVSSFMSIWALAWYSFGAALFCYAMITWLTRHPDPTENPDDDPA